MNTETFRIFCDVVYYQSFSRGAEANSISQSAATQSIHRLERQLGVQLVDRSKRPFVLTREGKICYEGFREILETYDSVISRVQSPRVNDSSAVRVAAIYSAGLYDMNKCMREFIKECPRSKIRLEFLHPEKVYNAILQSEADLGLVSYPSVTPELGVIPIRSEEMVVALPNDHVLAHERALSPKALRDQDFVGFERELPIRRETDKYLRQNNVQVNIVTEFDNIETIKQAIEVGLGLSILPRPTVSDDHQRGRLTVIPFENPSFFRPIGVIFKRRKIFSGAMTRFVEMLGGQFE